MRDQKLKSLSLLLLVFDERVHGVIELVAECYRKRNNMKIDCELEKSTYARQGTFIFPSIIAPYCISE